MQAKEIIRLYESLASERGTYNDLWQDIARNIYPRRGNFLSGGPTSGGIRRGYKVYDGTPMRALGLFTSALHSMLTNPATMWFEIWPFNEKLMKNFEVKKYMQTCSAVQFAYMVSSNFHSQVHECYTDLGCFGNSFMFIEPDPDFAVRYSSRPMAEIHWMLNDREVVDGFIRVFDFTPRQMIEHFGPKAVSEDVIKQFKKPETTESAKIRVLHLVSKRGVYDLGSINRLNRPYESTYVELNEKHKLLESGYYEFPCAGTRFAVESGERYGYGPGESALPEARSLHLLAKHTLRGAQKATDPAIMLPHKAFIGSVDLSAGALNYYKARGTMASSGPHTMVQPWPQGANFNVTFEEKRDMREQVERAFLVDKLHIRESDRMSATEVKIRAEENQRTLVQFLGRTNTELLNHVVQRTFNILARAGKFPPRPQALEGEPFKVKFVSPLAKSQRYSEVQALLSAMDAIAPLANNDPSILAPLKKPALLQFVFDAFGAPLDVIEDPEKFMQKIAEQERAREEQAQTMAQVQSAEGMAGAIKDVASATKDLGGSRSIQSMLQ